MSRIGALALALALSPRVAARDRDLDGIPDHVEDCNLNGRVDPGETDPFRHDTDRDGISDGVEDTNRNGRVDRGETDPRKADTDRDGVSDAEEDLNRNGRVDPGETDPRDACKAGRGRCPATEDLEVAGRGPRVPEPLLFDLVRGLGARRGELEVNVLGYTTRHGIFAWAPEVEWVLRDGWALELELPMQGDRPESLKLAAQGTFGLLAQGRGIHGFQAILEGGVGSLSISSSFLYLLAWRFSPAWSLLGMVGARGVGEQMASRVAALSNWTLFAELTRRWSVGLETTVEASWMHSRIVALSQIAWRFSDHWALQYGAGLEWDAGHAPRPILAARLAAFR